MRAKCWSSLRSASSVSDPLEARVVGHLVVARERRVHRRTAAHHVGEHAEHDQVAHAPRTARLGAARTCACARPRGRTSRRTWRHAPRPLQDHLPGEQDEHARDVEAVGEERAVARIRLLLGAHPADGEDHGVGLAGEQVAAAGAVVDEQPVAGRVAALDLRAVRRRRARHHLSGLLLDPAEGGDVLVRAEQDAGLARAGLRAQIGLPFGQPVRAAAEPAGHLGDVAVAHRPLQHRQRRARRSPGR